jgi:ethanolamine utilization protein EutQ (cupin superfamily)
MLVPMGETDLVNRPERPRAGTGRRAVGTDVVLGEWTLERAAWTDLHHHEELNYVIEGELHVTYDGDTYVAHAGDVVIVPAGHRARYEAPAFARMVFVYGPSTDGHATIDGVYEELR